MAKGIGRGRGKKALSQVTRSELEDLYFSKGLSFAQVGEVLGVTAGAIQYHFAKLGIKGRSHDDGLLLLGKQGRFTGEKNPRWTGGRYLGNGYWHLRRADHPRAGARGYVREHIIVWEEANGCSLPDKWHVHHKNGIKTDNRIENLEAMPPGAHRDVIPGLLRRIAALETALARLSDERPSCSCQRQRDESEGSLP